jgi:hypothetical protein
MSTSDRRHAFLVSFVLVFLAVVAAALWRGTSGGGGPRVTLETVEGRVRTITLAQMKRLPSLTRAGSYQNQFGNWKDHGMYTGVRLTDLVGKAEDYASIRVLARDGYVAELPRARVEDPACPLVLAYAFNGIEVPAWPDGLRLVVLPEDGSVGNDEYDAPSAGAFWVRNVTSITLEPSAAP